MSRIRVTVNGDPEEIERAQRIIRNALLRSGYSRPEKQRHLRAVPDEREAAG